MGEFREKGFLLQLIFQCLWKSENPAWMCLPEHHTGLDPPQPGLVQAVPRQLRTRLATWSPLNIVICIGGVHIYRMK